MRSFMSSLVIFVRSLSGNSAFVLCSLFSVARFSVDLLGVGVEWLMDESVAGFPEDGCVITEVAPSFVVNSYL